MTNGVNKRQIVEEIVHNGWKAVVFDIDGTLFPGASANHYIFSLLGETELMKRMEADYTAGLIDNKAVATKLARHFAGFSTSRLTATLNNDHFIKDAVEIAEELRKSGVKILVATVTWRFVAEWVANRLGGEAISGVELETQSGALTGKVKRHAYDTDKTKSLRVWCKSHSITLAECIAVGDSRSDLHLFENVGLSLAINPTAGAEKSATFAGEFDNLWELFSNAPLHAAK